MATFSSPKECVDYAFAVHSLAIIQMASGINSSRSLTSPFPGRCQESNRLWGALLGGGFSEPHAPQGGCLMDLPWPNLGHWMDNW